MYSNLPEEEGRIRALFYIGSISLIFIVLAISLFFLSSCHFLPKYLHATEDIRDDDVSITFDVKDKIPPQIKEVK